MKKVATANIKQFQKEIALEEISAKPINGFKYTGLDSLDRPINGIVPFQSADEARSRLEVSGIKVLTLVPISEVFKRKRDKNPSVIEMAQLAEQIAAQYEIGLTYDRICRILARVHPNEAIKRALNSVADKILFGQPAHVAFASEVDKKGEPFFPPTFINAFRLGYEIGATPDPETGESADTPVVMLRFFAKAQRRAEEIYKKIKGALYYPAGIFSAIFVAFFVEVYWIVPIFAQMFTGLLQGKDDALPLPTQIMLDVSDVFRSPLGWGLTILIFASVGFGIYYLFFNKKGIDYRERIILKLPIFKKFFVPFYASVFCRNLSLLWSSESDVRKRFTIVAETSTNPVFREMAEHFANQVPEGTSIAQLFNGYYLLLGDSFAPVAETIENAPGEGDKQLYNYAKFLEQEAEEQLDLAIAFMGQAAFFVAAGMVIFILLASYMPLISLVGKLSSH